MLRRIKDYVFTMVCIISYLSYCAVFVSAPFVAKASDVPSGRIARSIVATDTTIMMEKATHVLIGKVEGIESRWKEETKLIYTYVKVHVEELLKGTIHGKYVVIKHKGGEVGDIGVLVSDEPHFLLSEEIKVFLKHEETGEFTVYDGKMGKTSLVSSVSSGFNYTGVHWTRDDLPVPYYINENCTSDEVQAVQASFQTWEDDPESFMDYTYMGTTTRSNASLDGYNVVSWQPIDGPGGTLAQTAYWYDRTTHLITEFDIVFDEDETWSTAGTLTLTLTPNFRTGERLAYGLDPMVLQLFAWFQMVDSRPQHHIGADCCCFWRCGRCCFEISGSEDPVWSVCVDFAVDIMCCGRCSGWASLLKNDEH